MTTKTKDKANATLTGVFFIVAAISSIIGLKLYDPVLTSTNFIDAANSNFVPIVFGAINELILAVSAIGTAIVLYPYLKKYSESIGLGYLSFRLLEVVFIAIGTVSVLAALSVSQHYANGAIADKTMAAAIGLTFKAIHKWVFIMGPNFMLAVNTFLYSYVFFKTGLVPKPLATLGLIASGLIMLAAWLEMFAVIDQLSTWGVSLALPIAVYEMTLAVWLIVKGFRLSE